MAAPVETFAPEHPDRLSYNKAHKLSRQFFFLRVLLAAGLAVGLAWLPRELPEEGHGDGERAGPRSQAFHGTRAGDSGWGAYGCVPGGIGGLRAPFWIGLR